MLSEAMRGVKVLRGVLNTGQLSERIHFILVCGIGEDRVKVLVGKKRVHKKISFEILFVLNFPVEIFF
jgi:DNA polymerase II small subunit/DNA polymerase delta subunit B